MSRRDASGDGNVGGVGDRLDARLAVLGRWVEQGVPDAYAGRVPTSLTRARLWHEPALGIHPVLSPNAFVTTHPEYGDRVARIAAFVAQLRRNARSGGMPPAPAEARPAPDYSSLLERVASQWHSEKWKVVALERTLESQAQLLTALQREVDRLSTGPSGLHTDPSERGAPFAGDVAAGPRAG